MTCVSHCLSFATSIQRRYPLAQWHVGMRAVPAECATEVRQYLAIMAARARLAEAVRGRLGL